MNIVFMGTPSFAVNTLQKLYEEKHNIQMVITQPDKPYGRGKKIKKSKVKEKAEELGLTIFQPNKVRSSDSVEKIKQLNPDLIVVVAYGQILSKEVLNIPKLGCINVHASLLPKLRGAAPINWAIINGDKKTGITTMLMDVGLDTGDMLLKEEVDITDNMTAGELNDILSKIGAELLIKTVNKLLKDNIVPTKQNNDIFTYAPMLDKDIACIDWNETSVNVHNKVRGLNPDQVAYFKYEDKRIKVYKTEIIDEKSCEKPGYVTKVDKKGIYISTCDTKILIKELQFPGKKRMRVEDFLRGHKFPEKIVL